MYQDALELKIFFQIGNKGLFLLIEIVLISLYHGNPRLEGKSEEDIVSVAFSPVF